MKVVWEGSFASFAGPGIDHPNEMMRVTEDEARMLLAGLEAIEWQAGQPVPGHRGLSLCHAAATWTTALFHGDAIIGFYAASYLWLAKAYRGLGLSTPLILAAASQRGGSCMPPGVVSQGYTAASLAAHRSAYRQAVLQALADGLPVPESVVAALPLPRGKAGKTARSGGAQIFSAGKVPARR